MIVLEPWRSVSRAQVIATLVGVGLLALWMATDGDGYLRPLDDANLVFHEAGHHIYGILGSTLALYGGTLGQLTFPAVSAAIFVWRRERIGTVVGLAWMGENFGNIARYCDDARAQELPLVGGGEHDWFHILTRWDALDADHSVASAFRLIGWVLVLGPAVWLAWTYWRSGDPSTS